MGLNIDMRGKIRFSRWLMVATVLAVAEYTGAALLETASPAAAQAQSSGDFFRFTPPFLRSNRHSQNSFGPPNWGRQQRKPHQPSDISRAPQRKTKSKPEQNETTASEKPTTHGVGIAIATVQNMPLPRPRPPPWTEPHSFAEAAGPA